MRNRSLKALAADLPKLLEASRSVNTNKKYSCYFEKFEKWCSMFPEVKAYPSQESHVVLYLVSLIQSGQSLSVIESSFYSIKHYNVFCKVNPCDSKLCKMLLEAAKRLCKNSLTKKNPITVEMLNKIYENMKVDRCSLLELRTILMMVLGFCGFLRYSEIAELKRCDFVFQDMHVEIFIEKSKTDIYRDGHWLFLAKLDSKLCPVKLLQKYFQLSTIEENSNEFIFRGVTYFRTTRRHHLRRNNASISYTTARECVLKALTDIGLDSKHFGLHSLRAGGATAAANLGVEDRLFKKHGRWRSDRAKDGYIKDSIKSLLYVSSNLGL